MREYINKLNKFKKIVIVVSLIILGVFLFVAIFANILSPYNPYERVAIPFLKPSNKHILGTNSIGQDILSELIYGSRSSLLIGIISSIIAILTAVVLSLLSAYYGGKIEDIIMRITDFFLVIPFLSLVVFLSVYFRVSYISIALIIGLIYWPGPVRILRSQVIKVKNKDYILNIKSMGGK